MGLAVNASNQVVLQFNKTANISPTPTYTVLATADLGMPLADWMVVGSATNINTSVFQFMDTVTNQQRFYIKRSP